MSLSDEDYAALSEDIPDPSDPFIRQFLAGSTALRDQEAALRADAPFRKSLSPIARRAAAIVSRIRARENETVWRHNSRHGLGGGDGGGGGDGDVVAHPGMPFRQARPLIETTDLWRVVRRMPKGSALHAHLDGMVDLDHLLGVLLETPGMHVSADAPLCSPEALGAAAVSFAFRARGEDSARPVWSGDYVAGTWRALAKAADEFPDGGRDGFLRWMKDQCTLTHDEATATHRGPDDIWRSFGRCFQMTGAVLRHEPVFRAFLRRLMRDLHDDGVSWIELRFTWGLDYCREGQETPEPDHDAMFGAMEEELARFRSDPEHASFWGFRTIWTAPRALPRRGIVQDMDNCITAKLAYPDLVAGYDVCGKEDLGRSLKDLLPELFWFRKQCAQEGVEIPFFFHAGETLAAGPGSPDDNLYDAVLLGTRRLGHAFSLHRHPLLVDLVKERRILVESCVVSNEVLRLSGPVRTNPLPALLARGVPCALGSDVPAMLGASGASHDFYQALQGWDDLGLEGLGALAENSVRWSAFEDETAAAWAAGVREASLGGGIKARRLQEWAKAWERFCLWIVDEFGDEWEETEDGGGSSMAGKDGTGAAQGHK